jgi:anaerobic selenocysteine-containing dehydrogenase
MYIQLLYGSIGRPYGDCTLIRLQEASGYAVGSGGRERQQPAYTGKRGKQNEMVIPASAAHILGAVEADLERIARSEGGGDPVKGRPVNSPKK